MGGRALGDRIAPAARGSLTVTLRAAVSVALSVALALTAACTTDGRTDGDTPAPDGVDVGVATSADPGDGPPDVLMMGRSVMRGWFDHWGDEGDGRVAAGGFVLQYAELAGPPDLGSSAAAAIAGSPEVPVVFLKPCFVDFWASSLGDVETNVEELVGYANEVLAAAEENGARVILGTALPKIEAETTPALVGVHRRYAEEVERMAREHANVTVFDLNGILADDDGVLRPEFAVSEADSHLTEAAYDALDAEFFRALAAASDPR